MKVLLCVRQDYLKNTGGDTVIIKQIYKGLKSLDLEVYINSGNIYSFKEYDIVHLFNINEVGQMYKYYKEAIKCRCKLVITPLYFNMEKYYNYKNEKEKLKIWRSSNLYRQELLEKSCLIICGSQWEKALLEKDFKKYNKITVLKNGVSEIEDENVPLYNFEEHYDLSNYVLSVGKINERKNQLMLSKICNELNLQLVLIGGVNDCGYLKKCLKYKNVKYLGYMDNYNLFNAYKFAKVYALPSFMEITNLSALEAAGSGCNIVVTEEGAAREYFEGKAIYCSPYDEETVKKALIKAYYKRKNNVLKDYVFEKYNWNDTIIKLKQIYNKVQTEM
ncbi:MAG: glycosyltransferase family 4 protein [Clostridium sp.]